jgi:C4-dicarboxylate transporter DctM subunit
MNSIVIFELLTIFGVLFLMLLLKFPVFISMVGSLAAYAVIFPGSIPLSVFGQGIISGLSSQNYVAVCFYFFLGEIMTNGGLGDRLIEFMDACLGHVRGSLSHINILSSMVFAGVSGSAVADTASIGSMNLNLMKKAGYPAGYAAAVTAISSTIGPIIPPSSGLVMLGVYFGYSVQKLYLGGIIPGVLMGVVMLVVSTVLAIKNDYPSSPWRGWGYVAKKAKEGLLACLLPAMILLCLLLGVGTVVEVGATSCLLAIILAAIHREITPKKLLVMLMRTAILSGATLAMLGFAGLFTWVISSMGVASWIAAQIASIGASETVVMAVCMLILFILGMIVDVPVVLMIIFPVMVPVVKAIGINPVWFSVVGLIVNQLGLCTPPVGTLIYMTAKIGDCPSSDVIKHLIPYIIALIILIAVMIVCPQIVTFLPEKLG